MATKRKRREAFNPKPPKVRRLPMFRKGKFPGVRNLLPNLRKRVLKLDDEP